jgi:hypothetical protein
VHGNEDTNRALRAIEKIVTGLKCGAAEPVAVVGQPTRNDLDACRELGAVLASDLTLEEG